MKENILKFPNIFIFKNISKFVSFRIISKNIFQKISF